MWLREDNCTLNILFVLQLVLTRWPPMYDPVFRCTVCTVCTVIVQCMGPVPQSARDNQPVQISAEISAKRSTTSLWWVQDDFNNKENSDIDMWLKRSKCWLCWVICSRIKQRLLAMWSDLKTANTMLYTSLSCENLTGIPEYDFRGHGGHMPVHHARFSEWPLVSVGPGPLVSRRPLYRPKKSSKGMFKRRRIIDPYGGHFER